MPKPPHVLLFVGSRFWPSMIVAYAKTNEYNITEPYEFWPSMIVAYAKTNKEINIKEKGFGLV